MAVALSIMQGLVGFVFVLAGVMKVSRPKEQLARIMQWVDDITPSRVRLIGLAEMLGAFGLVIPGTMGTFTWLTPLSAACLAIIMVGAIATHMRRGETNRIVLPIILLVLTGFIAVGRTVLAPL